MTPASRVAMAANLPGPTQAGASCGGFAWAATGIQAHVVPVSGGGGLTCFQPIPRGTITASGGARTTTGGPPADGTPCEMHVQEPVTLTTSGNTLHASYPQPGLGYPGQDVWDSTSQALGYDQLVPEPGFLRGDGDMAGVHDVLVPFTYFNGKYKNGQCAEAPGGHWENVEAADPETICPLFNPNSALGVCSATQTHLPASVPPAPSGALLDFLRSINTQVNGGAIHSSPNDVGPVQGLVNLQTHFRIDGENPAPGQPLQLGFVDPGPGDGSRAIIYEYLITITLQSVIWNFDDGNGPYPGTVTVDKLYPQISPTACKTCGPGGSYHVTASLNYGLQVTAIWTVGDGATHTQNMTNLNVTIPPATATPEDLKVGQIEGVPVG